MRCPRCGGAIAPDPIRGGVYQCAQCGDVELDEGAAYVAGRFYEVGALGGEETPPACEDADFTALSYSLTWEDILAGEDLPPPGEE